MSTQEDKEARAARALKFQHKAKQISERFDMDDEEAAEFKIKIKGMTRCSVRL